MTPHLPVTTGRKVVQALERGGFLIHHTTGSHAIMRHTADSSKRVTVPMHTKDLKPGTMRHIIKQAGLSVTEFLELL